MMSRCLCAMLAVNACDVVLRANDRCTVQALLANSRNQAETLKAKDADQEPDFFGHGGSLPDSALQDITNRVSPLHDKPMGAVMECSAMEQFCFAMLQAGMHFDCLDMLLSCTNLIG